MQTKRGFGRVSTILAVLAALLVATGANAEPITVVFEGGLSHIDPSLDGRFELGDVLRMVLTYESTTPDRSPGDPLRGYYAAITNIEISVDGYTASGSDGDFTVQNDELASDGRRADLLSAQTWSPDTGSGGTLAGAPVDGMPLWRASFSLLDWSGTALSSDALPTIIDPSLFDDFHRFGVEWRNGGSNVGITAEDFTCTVVPVPGALLLGGLGLGWAGWLCRRTTRSA